MRFDKKIVYTVLLLFTLVCIWTLINKMIIPSSRSDNYHVYNYNGQLTGTGITATFDKLSGFRTVLGFDATSGQEVNVQCSSEVDGKFKIIMLGPRYNILEEFSANLKESRAIRITQTGKHIFRIVGDSAGGQFAVSLTSHNGLELIR